MSDRAKNHVLIIIGVVTCALTVAVQVVNFGELKGKIQTVIQMHEQRLHNAEQEVRSLQKDVSNIEGRLHGIASQVGKVPAQVAEKLKTEALR